ncbi:hypothetical protein P5V15_014409 [Pogonomyrmex californicus]
MYGGGSAGSAGYGVGLGPGPSHYAPPSATVGYQLGPPPPPAACPATAGNQLLSYGPDLSPHHIQQAHTETQSKRRRETREETLIGSDINETKFLIKHSSRSSTAAAAATKAKEASLWAVRGLTSSNANEVLRSVAVRRPICSSSCWRDAPRSPRGKQTAVDCRSARTNARSLAPAHTRHRHAAKPACRGIRHVAEICGRPGPTQIHVTDYQIIYVTQ